MALDRDHSSECEQLDPSARASRGVAGESVEADVIACTATEPLRAELLAAFPDGVCDHTLPGRGEVEHARTWQRF